MATVPEAETALEKPGHGNNTDREFKGHLRWAGIKPHGTLSLHMLRKSCIQNWANRLLINVTKELGGQSSIDIMQKYYLQVDEYHRAKAAAVIDSLLSEAKAELDKNDAGMTTRGYSGQNHAKRQF